MAADAAPGLDDRDRRRRVRIADRLRDRGLPRLPPPTDHRLRHERHAGRARTSSSPTTSARRSCARSRSRTSCRPTGRRSRSSTRGRGAARRRSLRSIRRQVQPGRAGHPRRGDRSCSDGLGWDDSRYPSRVGWLQREGEDRRCRTSCSTTRTASFVGRAKHVMLARRPRPAVVPARAREGAAGSRARRPDRAGLRAEGVRPGGALRRRRRGHRVRQRVGERARRSARSVISLLRNPEPDEQDLNTPRCFFEALGIDAFQALSFDQRIAVPRPRSSRARRRSGAAGRRGSSGGRAEGRFDAAASARSTTSSPARSACAIHVVEQARRRPRLAST